MAETKRKGDLGQTIIMAKIMLQGFKVAIPVGEDWRFDLIVYRNEELLRVQCKYVTSDGKVVRVPCRSANSHCVRLYTPKEIDWLICYDATTDRCYYIPSSKLGRCHEMRLRLTPTSRRLSGTLYAEDFLNW